MASNNTQSSVSAEEKLRAYRRLYDQKCKALNDVMCTKDTPKFLQSVQDVADAKQQMEKWQKLVWDAPAPHAVLKTKKRKSKTNKARIPSTDKRCSAATTFNQPVSDLGVSDCAATENENALKPSPKRQKMEGLVLPDLKKWMTIADRLDEDLDFQRGTVISSVPKTVFGTNFEHGLFIRQEYLDMLDIINSELASDKSIRRILVVGSPGIGLSVFGVLMFLLAMKERKDVAYHPMNHAFTYYFTWNGNKYDTSDKRVTGKKYEGYFDGQENADALGDWFHRVYLFSNPSSKNYNEFAKNQCVKVCLNPWNKFECTLFVQAIQLDDDDEWYQRFNLVGGKPKLLFSPSPDFDELVKRVKDDIFHIDEQFADQALLLDQDASDDTMKHILFNMDRSETSCTEYCLSYPSLIVEMMIKEHYNQSS